MPNPFRIQPFCELISDWAGTPVVAYPMEDVGAFPGLDACNVNGLVCVDALDGSVVISYRRSVPLWLRIVSLLHEAAHVVLGHLEDLTSGTALSWEGYVEMPGSMRSDASPTWRKVMGRSDIRDPQEAAAEMLAILMLDQMHHKGLPTTGVDLAETGTLRAFVGPLRAVPFG